jgi:hypothetical protein
MQSTEIKVLDVDSQLVDKLWSRVEHSGSFYSIGDGVTKENFRRVLYGSSYVVAIDGGIVRLDIGSDYVELHPIAFSHAIFRNAHETIEAIYSRFVRSFQSKPICCIIPSEMRAAKVLAQLAGMHYEGVVYRLLSGVKLACSVYSWRPENV